MKQKLLLLLCLSAKMLLAQDSILIKDFVVLANVLNLREKPNKDAAIIEKIPKFQKVEIIQWLDNVDSIECVPLKNIDRCSDWVKVKYKDKIGYLVSYYLGQRIKMTKFHSAPIVIQYPYWYKIEVKGKSDFLKKIEVKLDTLPEDEMGGGDRLFIVEKSKRIIDEIPIYFGSIEPLKTGKIGNFYQDCDNKNVDFNDDRDCLPKYFDERKTLFEMTKDNRFLNHTILSKGDNIYFSNGKNTQLLLSNLRGFSVKWFGDFDFDKKADFILEVDSSYLLFLSSKAQKGDLVKMVSHHTWCDCD
jgi:Bacterial SH3 domain